MKHATYVAGVAVQTRQVLRKHPAPSSSRLQTHRKLPIQSLPVLQHQVRASLRQMQQAAQRRWGQAMTKPRQMYSNSCWKEHTRKICPLTNLTSAQLLSWLAFWVCKVNEHDQHHHRTSWSASPPLSKSLAVIALLPTRQLLHSFLL